MPVFAIVCGVILEIIGISGYILTGAESITALIPSIFGTILLACGVLSIVAPKTRKHAMHVAALVAVLGFVAVIGRIAGKIPALLSGAPVEPSNLAVSLQLAFAVVCFFFFTACIRSFLLARLAAVNKE